MLRGLYTSASGMSAQQIAQDLISNNIANANTTGYKKDMAVNSAFNQLVISRVNDPYNTANAPISMTTDINDSPVVGTLGTGVQPAGTFTDYANGALQHTENPFDVAMNGEGFFVIQTPAGERYTRDGSFTINAQGDLVTKDGYSVMGRQGAINVGDGQNMTIGADGSVVVNGTVVNNLLIVAPETAQALHKVGGNLYALSQGGTIRDAVNTQVAQGYLESSNVNVVSEMVSMISGLRIYEANQKAVQMQDQSLGLLISDVARV